MHDIFGSNNSASAAKLREMPKGSLDPVGIISDFRLCEGADQHLSAEEWSRLLDQWNRKTLNTGWNQAQREFAVKVFRAYSEVFLLAQRMSEVGLNQAKQVDSLPDDQKIAFLEEQLKRNTLAGQINKLTTSAVTANSMGQILALGLLKNESPNHALDFMGSIVRHTIDSYKQVMGYKPSVFPTKLTVEVSSPDTFVEDVRRFQRVIARETIEAGLV